MMLYVVCGTQEFSWHLGESFKSIETQVKDMIDANAELQTRLEVQADGDELQFIIDHFKNLPHVIITNNTWYGDHARFIIGNMNSATLYESFFKDHLVEEEK